MATIFSTAQIERFKREAKRLCRTTPSQSHSAALDHIAVQNGYPNWSLLHKHSRLHSEHATSQTVSVLPPLFLFIRTTEEMREALRKLPETRDRYLSRTDEARAQVEGIRDLFVSPANAVDYAIAYLSGLLALPRLRIDPASKANWEIRCWLPYCVHPITDDNDYAKGQILLNRRYKPVGQITDDRADYGKHANLHLNLSLEEITELTAKNCVHGYLYDDGSCPWHSRKHAESYLDRLQILQTMLKN